ncbi:uncharacterized protein LOC113333575 [Papaver somniferum]|uniref:uncharacterized protein LOC113333575 n=1 Tax=Papaver somniferum TaxID=3469 RepID=UPI000E705D41|nr:uncharacterized protein LOC113333575 [Papaver somniferum]
MSEKFVHAVLNHGEHSSAFRVNIFITVDELKHFAFALVIQMNNEDFYLNVDVIPKHTGCSTSSRSFSRSNSGCSSSSGASTSNSCVIESPKLVRVVDHEADKAKPLIIDEWLYVFDNIGREFVGGVKAVRIVVDQYKMCTDYKILILKNDKTRFTAKCEEDGYGWRIHFGPVNGDISRFVLKDSNVIHSIQGDPILKPKHIMSLLKKTYGSNIKYHHARRGKEAVFEDQYGDDEKSYSDLNWYVKAIEQTSPDSFVKLEVDEETGRFKRIFICFGACKHSYKYLRPMIYLDATFLIGRFRGTLMAATCVNGNDVVDDRPIDFFSDRHEGLLQGIPRAFPGSYHSYCFYHIKCNLPIVKGDANYNAVIDLFYKAAYSYTTSNFEEALRGMHAIGCGHVANYLRTIPKEKWANAFFPVCRYASRSSSIAESLNNWILEFKKLPAFDLLDAIHLKVMQMNSKIRVEGLENFNTRLTPVYEDLLNENINIGRTWTVVESMERLYEVRSPRTHSVDLLERTWKTSIHLWSHTSTTEWYNWTYQEIIFPIPNYDKPQSYDPSDRIIVPITVPPPGRRIKQRFKKAWEKQKRPMIYTKCFTLGHHNRATCPMP